MYQMLMDKRYQDQIASHFFSSSLEWGWSGVGKIVQPSSRKGCKGVHFCDFSNFKHTGMHTHTTAFTRLEGYLEGQAK